MRFIRSPNSCAVTGGATVVMGAWTTRNAQVALYQSGDVDFLVATDAIGMGLNMDIDHVAFAATEKFDGAVRRPLRANELARNSRAAPAKLRVAEKRVGSGQSAVGRKEE
jgi:hypothetical protein